MISVHVDTSSALQALENVRKDQLPYATSRALNALANQIQKDIRQGVEARYKLRRREWLLRQAAYIAGSDRATKQKLWTIVQITPSAGFLSRGEEGSPGAGQHIPHGKYVWIPNPQVFGSKVIQRSNPLHPKNLQMQRKGGLMVGTSRTFMVKTGNQVLVLQRVDRGLTGRSKRLLGKMDLDSFSSGSGYGPSMKGEKYSLSRNAGTRLLYVLKHTVVVPLKLRFKTTASQTINAYWAPLMQQAMSEAMRSAR